MLLMFTLGVVEVQFTAGAMLSTTVTLNEAVPRLPEASVALNVTVVTPTGKVPPLAMPAVLVGVMHDTSITLRMLEVMPKSFHKPFPKTCT